jgi:hypothetical protein
MEAWTDTEVRNYLGEPEQVAFDTIRQFHPDLETRHVPQYLVYNPPVSNVRPLCLESPAITIMYVSLFSQYKIVQHADERRVVISA